MSTTTVKRKSRISPSRILGFLASMKLGMGLFVSILVLSFLGTTVPTLYPHYQTSWFYVLALVLLCLNTGFCTFRTLPGLLKNKTGNVRQKIYRWSIWFIHFSVLIIAGASMASSLLAQDAAVELRVGNTVSLPAEYSQGKSISLTLEDFRTEYHSNGSIAAWISYVSTSTNGSVQKNTIRVNHPLQLGLASILQSSYSEILSINLIQNESKIPLEARFGDFVALNADGTMGLRFTHYDNTTKAYFYEVYINKELAGVLNTKIDVRVKVNEELSFELAASIPVSGLRLRYDPALLYVWFGFVLMGLAMCGMLFGERTERRTVE